MILLILGPQGSGKGTQGKLLAEHLRIPLVGAGDLLRAEIATGSDLGKRIHQIINVKGDLVPPNMVTDLLDARLKQPDAAQGLVIDSYPRDLEQLDLMYKRFMPDMVVALELSDDEAVKRLSARRTCPDGHIYHLELHPPKKEGVCDVDGKELFLRKDDNEAAIRNRLSWHRSKTEPMIRAMEERGLRVVHIDAAEGIDEIQKKIQEAVAHVI